jgi:hypothetical protein
MVDDVFEIIFDIIGEVLTSIKRKDKNLKNIKGNNNYNLRPTNKIDFFNNKTDHSKKNGDGSINYSKETKIITEIVGANANRGILCYTENGTGKLIEIKINENIY